MRSDHRFVAVPKLQLFKTIPSLFEQCDSSSDQQNFLADHQANDPRMHFLIFRKTVSNHGDKRNAIDFLT